MSMKIRLFTSANDFSEPELLGPLDAPKKHIFVDFEKILESGSIMDRPFELWDGDSKCVIQTKLDPFNI